MSIPKKNANAWLLIGEDNPSGSSYKTPGSCYQTLIDFGVYKSTDQVNLCFYITVPTGATTVPAGDGSQYTLELGNATDTHPDGSTNQQYMDWAIADSRASNPDIKLFAMLGYDKAYISQVLNQGGTSPTQRQQNATHFANNLVQYLVHYDLDGFDVDWEAPLYDNNYTTKDDFKLFFSAIRTSIDQYNSSNPKARQLYLTLSPAYTTNMDVDTVNDHVDWLNLQVYSGFSDPSTFLNYGIDKRLLQYGCKFESMGNGIVTPKQTAVEAYAGYSDPNWEYVLAINWRLNSGNFHYEQASQIFLAEMIHGTGMTFDDSNAMRLGGYPPITSIKVRHGEVLDALQYVNKGSFTNSEGTIGVTTYTPPRRGGGGGSEDTISLSNGELITEVTGYTGVWFGWNCVLQISFKTNKGNTFGPYGNMRNATTKNPFTWTPEGGESLICFSGELVNVPLSSGGRTDVIKSLTPVFKVASGNFPVK